MWMRKTIQWLPHFLVHRCRKRLRKSHVPWTELPRPILTFQDHFWASSSPRYPCQFQLIELPRSLRACMRLFTLIVRPSFSPIYHIYIPSFWSLCPARYEGNGMVCLWFLPHHPHLTLSAMVMVFCECTNMWADSSKARMAVDGPSKSSILYPCCEVLRYKTLITSDSISFTSLWRFPIRAFDALGFESLHCFLSTMWVWLEEGAGRRGFIDQQPLTTQFIAITLTYTSSPWTNADTMAWFRVGIGRWIPEISQLLRSFHLILRSVYQDFASDKL